MGKKLYLERTAAVPDKLRMPSPVNPIVGTLKLWMSTRSDFDDKLAERKVSVKSATRRVLAATKDRRAWADHARDALDVETDPRYMRGAGRRDSTPASRSASAAQSEASLAAAAADGSDGAGGIGSGAADGANGSADAEGHGGGSLADSSAKMDAGVEPLSALAGGGGGVRLAREGDHGGSDVADAAAAQGDSSGGGDDDNTAAKGSFQDGAATAPDSEMAAHPEALDLDLGVDRAAYWSRYDSVDLDSESDAISGARRLRSASSAAAAVGGDSLSYRRPAAAASSSSVPRRGVAASATSPRAGAGKLKRPPPAVGRAGGGDLRRRVARPKLWQAPPPSLGAIRRKKLWCPMCCGMCASAHAVEAAMHMLSLRGGGGGASPRRRPPPKLSVYSLQSGATAFT